MINVALIVTCQLPGPAGAGQQERDRERNGERGRETKRTRGRSAVDQLNIAIYSHYRLNIFQFRNREKKIKAAACKHDSKIDNK